MLHLHEFFLPWNTEEENVTVNPTFTLKFYFLCSVHVWVKDLHAFLHELSNFFQHKSYIFAESGCNLLISSYK